MKKAHYKKSIIALLVVLMYLLIAVAFAKILPLAVLQDLTNSNIKRRILYDAIQAAAVIPFAATYFRSADFRKTETPSKWIPWGLIGVCAILVTIILPERVYAFWFYLIIVGCGEEFVVKAKLFCPEIAGLFCRIAGLFCHDSRANLSLKPVCFGIAIS